MQGLVYSFPLIAEEVNKIEFRAIIKKEENGGLAG
jgi:hypothetical protein